MPLGHAAPASMNYSNMIEEKSLKVGAICLSLLPSWCAVITLAADHLCPLSQKTFIIATLISTIVGTFTTGINLYDRVADKRSQQRTDHGQNEKIDKLEKRVDEAEGQRDRANGREGQLRRSLEYGGPLVRREYDQNYSQLGSRFAEGDREFPGHRLWESGRGILTAGSVVAQTQLQGQIITLQGTVIKLLEEALMTGRPPDINKLYNASEFAREGSIRALRDQYQRMLQSAPLQRPGGPVRRISSQPAMRRMIDDRPYDGREGDRGGGPRPPPAGALYCSYAEELQDTDRPLDPNFKEGGSGECPACGFFIPVEQGRSWKVDKQVTRESSSRGKHGNNEVFEVSEDRTYRLTNRFIVKCHREGGGFACFLCYEFRDTDTLCRTIEGLVGHVSKRHNVREYEDEIDIRARK
jgi:hypothetical protein